MNINRIDGQTVSAAQLDHGCGHAIVPGESRYVYHPAVLDNLLQLSLIAAHCNLPHQLSKRYLPYSFGSIILQSPLESDLSAPFQIVASGDLHGVRGLMSDITMTGASGRTLVYIKEAFFLASDSGPVKPRPSNLPYLRVDWKPDVDFFTASSMNALHPPTFLIDEFGAAALDELALLQITQFRDVHLQEFDSSLLQPHLQNFLDWLTRKVELACQDDFPGGKKICDMTIHKRSDRIKEILDSIKPHSPEARTMCNIYENLPSILANETSGIEVALQNNLLFEMYEKGKTIHEGNRRLAELLGLLMHKRPGARILEIGAGTGSATKEILPKLKGDTLFRTYREYVFSDVTPSFLKKAEEHFQAFGGLTYVTFDMEKPVQTQELIPDFDVLVASNVGFIPPPKFPLCALTFRAT